MNPLAVSEDLRSLVLGQVKKLAPAGAAILDETTLGELQFDSLDVVELQLLIEMEFEHGRRFSFDDVKDAWSDETTVGDIVARTTAIAGGAS